MVLEHEARRKASESGIQLLPHLRSMSTRTKKKNRTVPGDTQDTDSSTLDNYEPSNSRINPIKGYLPTQLQDILNKTYLPRAIITSKKFQESVMALPISKEEPVELFHFSVTKDGNTVLDAQSSKKLYIDPCIFDDIGNVKNVDLDLSLGYELYDPPRYSGTRYEALKMFELENPSAAKCDIVITRGAMNALLLGPYKQNAEQVCFTKFDDQIFVNLIKKDNAFDKNTMTGHNFEHIMTRNWEDEEDGKQTKKVDDGDRFCSFVLHKMHNGSTNLNVLISCEIDACFQHPSTIPREADGSSSEVLKNYVEIKCRKNREFYFKSPITANYLAGCEHMLVGYKSGFKLNYTSKYRNSRLMKENFRNPDFINVWFVLVVLWVHDFVQKWDLKPLAVFKILVGYAGLSIVRSDVNAEQIIPSSFIEWRKSERLASILPCCVQKSRRDEAHIRVPELDICKIPKNCESACSESEKSQGVGIKAEKPKRSTFDLVCNEYPQKSESVDIKIEPPKLSLFAPLFERLHEECPDKCQDSEKDVCKALKAEEVVSEEVVKPKRPTFDLLYDEYPQKSESVDIKIEPPKLSLFAPLFERLHEECPDKCQDSEKDVYKAIKAEEVVSEDLMSLKSSESNTSSDFKPGFCCGLTLKKARCKNKVKMGNLYCWLHKSQDCKGNNVSQGEQEFVSNILTA